MKKIKSLLLILLLSGNMIGQNLIGNLNRKMVTDYYIFSEAPNEFILMVNLKKPLNKKDKPAKIVFNNPNLMYNWDIKYVVEYTVVICKMTPVSKRKNLCLNTQ
jgi:hypothetical protein